LVNHGGAASKDFASTRPLDPAPFTHYPSHIPDRRQAIFHAVQAIKDDCQVRIDHQPPRGIGQIQPEILKWVKDYDDNINSIYHSHLRKLNKP